MNPVMETLLGMKAFNDRFIAQDLLQDNRLRMNMLADCLNLAGDGKLCDELLLHLTYSVQLEERLLKLCLDKGWLIGDASEQWKEDIKWARKARQMIKP